ncbi:hypothetical protein EVAR_98658_1 [Eumeta japonica]|uniref:Uncharacterized protein n=1 Tax=Eumeta variegata TaxID=151549 RepID=A0A4C1XY47_EUMVA|nr:hypothetical protein EVAR_98658_1 [Eumeta japonica]
MRHMPPTPVRNLTSRPELQLDRIKKPFAYSWRYFVLPDVFTKIYAISKIGLCVLKDDSFLEYHSVDTLTPRRLKRDNPRREYELGRQNRRNELTEPTPSASKV